MALKKRTPSFLFITSFVFFLFCSHTLALSNKGEIEEANSFHFKSDIIVNKAIVDLDKMVMKRDNTFVKSDLGLWVFFVRSLKSIAVWGDVKLTPWVMSEIRRRAKIYENYYNQRNSGVIKAANHWDDLMRRSKGGKEPDHILNRYGFQNTEDCPMCSKQLSDLKIN